MALNRPIGRDTAHFGSGGDHVSHCQHQSYSGIKSYSTGSFFNFLHGQVRENPSIPLESDLLKTNEHIPFYPFTPRIQFYLFPT